jgi:hypothetical protein
MLRAYVKQAKSLPELEIRRHSCALWSACTAVLGKVLSEAFSFTPTPRHLGLRVPALDALYKD